MNTPDLSQIRELAVQLRELIPLVLDARTVLMLAAACWFAGGVAALLATRRALRHVTRKVARLEQLANSTSMDLKTLLREGTSFDTSHRELQSALALLGERQAQLELRATGGGAYEHAIDLARMGLSPEQLMRTVGLTRGEAELVAHLHRNGAAA
jgi:hypothetical protein